MLDLLKNYKSKVDAKKKNFKLKFRSKKDRLQSIVIPSRDWGRKSGEFSFLMGIKSSERIPEKMEYDCRLTINRLGEFYLCIPKPLEIKADNQGPKFSVVEEKKGAGIISLDPGVREHSLLAITQMVKPLNGRKGILIEYIAYAYIMIGSKRKGF